ncbi:MAG TPA: TetR/AcrR family transcriptional regulator C-terminal ligand-binding domain-containing protein [Candidatus Limnocylindrales bacterium]|nr:TetR/AcrR family transcriptional regulator C-terminal ligand-binding domain-containing protein [Candidatus Limnocylindrales bacterium]
MLSWLMRQSTSGQRLERDNGAKRQPGRPRSEHARHAILRSTLKLLQRSGFPDLSIEAIAADARVGKTTVYRWWPDKGALVVDAFASSTETKLHFPDTGSVYRDMSLQMNQFLGILRTRRGRIVAELLGAGQADPKLLEAFRERFLRPRRQEAYKTLQRGIDRGELPKTLDLDIVLDVLYGAIYMRFLIRHDELSESYVKEVCHLVLGNVAANSNAVGQNHGRKKLEIPIIIARESRS